MSNWYKKVEYECHCGQDYGSCEKIGKFFLQYHGVSDVYSLHQQSHPNEKASVLGWFDDSSLNALSELLNKKFDELSGCTSEEIENINQRQK